MVGITDNGAQRAKQYRLADLRSIGPKHIWDREINAS